MADASFEQAQVEAMELLLQQVVAPQEQTLAQAGNASAQTASLMDFLAEGCEKANAAVQELDYADVAASLAQAVAATQESLRSVRENVNEILQDPEKLQALCQSMQATNQHMIEAMEGSSQPLIMDGSSGAAESNEGALAVVGTTSTELSLTTDEENVRNMMQFAENMCSMMDTALSTITKDELDLAAQLSLSLAQKLLEAGQSLFLSLGDEERLKAQVERADRITIEELPEEEESQVKARMAARAKRQRMKHEAVLRNYMQKMISTTRDQATEHPYLAGALAAGGLPFIGFAIPIASILGVALMMEKYYPEHTSVAIEMTANFTKVMKLWFLLLKISARQVGVVAKECFLSWYEYASEHGFITTGMELASTCCTLGWLGVSRLYSGAMDYVQISPS